MTQVVEWNNGETRRVEDSLAGEEPLEMRSGRQRLGVTLRTPGNDAELAAGFLFTEGIISKREEILAVEAPDDSTRRGGDANNIVRIKLKPRVPLSSLGGRRFSAGSACGTFGKHALAQLRPRGSSPPDRHSRFL